MSYKLKHGKVQRTILMLVSGRPMTINGLTESTGYSAKVITSGVKGLLFKGLIVKEGRKFQEPKHKENEKERKNNVVTDRDVRVSVPYSWDIQKEQGNIPAKVSN